MALIVQKFGGTSVKDRGRIFNVARIVMNTRNAGNDVVVVVSAQGDTTDDLIAKAAEITSDPSHREMDMLLATGEQISIALLTMALQELGVSAISLTGWQAGFSTDRSYSKARIKRLDTERVESELARNRVVVVAGFQGLNRSDDITTLGRGGSDTSAVALAAALHADRCQIYTDVEGVYTADPRKIPKATKLKEITFDEMLELASLGAQVLNNRSVELAKKYNVELEVISSINPVPGTIVKEEANVEGMLIKGVAKDNDVAVISIKNVPDVPGMSFKVFSLLAQKNINVDIILQSSGNEAGTKDLSFTVPLGDAEGFGGLRHAQLLIVVEHHCRPLLLRQAEHRLPQAVGGFLLCGAGQALQLVGVGHPALLFPQLTGAVDHDFQQPGPGGLRCAQPVPGLPGPQHGFSHRVLRVSVAVQHGPGRAEQAAAVPGHHRGKLFPGPLRRRRHQFHRLAASFLCPDTL